jgi:hypothetical protein
MTKTQSPTNIPFTGEDAVLNITNVTGELDDHNAAKAGAQSPYSEPPPEQETVSPEMAAAVIKMPFALASLYFGEHWNLSDAEARLMSAPAAKLFSHAAGRFAESNPDAFVLGFALCIAVGPRAAQTMANATARRAAAFRAARMGAVTVPAEVNAQVPAVAGEAE